jgi:peptide deformylase (EC 3.5.1.88)
MAHDKTSQNLSNGVLKYTLRLTAARRRIFNPLLVRVCGKSRILQNIMARLDILNYPDPRLYTVAKPVQTVDQRIRTLIDDMRETMYAAPGIGLAATQVNVHERLLVMDISETRDDFRVFINPEIIAQRGQAEGEEGCLSVPGIYDRITRAEWIKVRAQDRDGKPFELEAEGLLAVCIQHEMDHLLGKVFVDYLSPLKRNRIKSKLQKQAREHRPYPASSRTAL